MFENLRGLDTTLSNEENEEQIPLIKFLYIFKPIYPQYYKGPGVL